MFTGLGPNEALKTLCNTVSQGRSDPKKVEHHTQTYEIGSRRHVAVGAYMSMAKSLGTVNRRGFNSEEPTHNLEMSESEARSSVEEGRCAEAYKQWC